MPFPFASPDRLLARFVRTGDARALGKLFDRTAPELLRLAAWLCGNRADAEDLLQRTFLTVLTKQGGYDPARRAMPWLCGILGNHARKLHEQRPLRATTTLVSAAPANDDPVRDAADAEFAAAVVRVRTELGSPYAEVLDLHLAEGLDAKRIAERLGRPAGTVRTQIVRGLELLRRHLPRGFVAGLGLGLGASVQAASLAAVRAAVMAQATATAAVSASAIAAGAGGTVMTFGGMVMGKKLAWFVPAVLLLLGGGAFWWQQQQQAEAGAPPVPAPAVVAAVPVVPPPRTTTAAANPTELRTEREAANAPDTPLAAPGFATLVVRIRWADDQSPAANVGVHLRPHPGNRVNERERLTDHSGTAILARIRPGKCSVETTFTEVQWLELEAETVRELELTANRDGFVEGMVVDSNHRPVPDARLWLSARANYTLGFEVGRSDAEGRFRLPARTDTYLGARKAGFAPSRVRYLQKLGKPIELVLPKQGGNLRGKVVDAANQPIAAAQLSIGGQGGWVVPGSTIEEHWLMPMPAMVTTDEVGEFAGDGVEPGDLDVRAWAEGHAPTAEKIRVDAGSTSRVTLVLQAGAVVTGVVRDPKGRPIAEASVRAMNETNEPTREFGYPSATSDAAGAFRLEDLPVGRVILRAGHRGAKATQTIDTVANAAVTWDPTLEVSGVLAGRVVGPDDQPVAGLLVGTFEPGQPISGLQRPTDADGRFELNGIDGTRVDLVFSSELSPIATRRGVAVGSEAALIRLTDAEMPTAFLRTRVLDTAGQPVAASLMIMSVAFGQGQQASTGPDGTVRHGPLPPGGYGLVVTSSGYGELRLAPVVLHAREELTIPDVVLSPAGMLEVRIAGQGHQHGITLRVLRGDGESVAWLTTEAGKARRELPPGQYLVLGEAGGARGSVPVTVRSKESVQTTLAFQPATTVAFECRFGGARPDGRVMVFVHDAADTLVDVYELHMHVHGGPKRNEVKWQNQLLPGDYRLTARTDDGRVAQQRLVVGANASAEPVVIEFSPR